jgi:HAMP domain-containing protein
MQHEERSFFKTLRGKLSLQMLLIGLVPALLVGVIVYGSMYSAQQSDSDSWDSARAELREEVAATRLIEQASSRCTQIDDWLTAAARDAIVWASTPVVVEAATSGSADNPEADAYLQRQLEMDEFFGEMVLTDDEGNAAAGAYKDITERIVVAGVAPEYEAAGYDLSGLLWWQSAWEDGMFLGNRVYLEEFGVYSFDIVTQIKETPDGDPVGIFKASILNSPLLAARSWAEGVSDGRVVIFDREGLVLCDSGDSTRNTESSQELTAAERGVVTAAVDNGNTSGYVITESVIAGFSVVVDTSSQIYGITDFSGLGWTIMIEQPVSAAGIESLDVLESNLEDTTRTMLITLGVVLVIVILMALALAFWMSRRITRPVAQLRDAAERVSRGDLTATVPEGGDDEIGDLTDSFERMITAVRFLSLEEEDDGEAQS